MGSSTVALIPGDRPMSWAGERIYLIVLQLYFSVGVGCADCAVNRGRVARESGAIRGRDVAPSVRVRVFVSEIASNECSLKDRGRKS